MSRTDAVETEAVMTGPERGRDELFGRGLLYAVVMALQLVTGSFISPILAHVMPPAEFGALASAIALHQVLSVFVVLGLDKAVVLQRGEDGDSTRARGLVMVAVVLSAASSLLMAATVPLWQSAFGFDGRTTLIVAVILWTAPGALVGVALGLLMSEDRLRLFAVISAISGAGGPIAGILLLVFAHDDATTYAWGGVATQFIAAAIGLIVTRPRLRGIVDWQATRAAIAIGVPLTLGSLANFVLGSGDRIVIQSLMGPVAVGHYQVAYVLGSAVVMLLTFVSGAWTARFAEIRDDATRWALAGRSRDSLYRLLLPVILGVALGAPITLRVIAPASFSPAALVPVTFVVALAAFPFAAAQSSGLILITARRGVALGVIAGVGAVLNIAFNLLLVPVLGIMGAAVATFAAYCVLAALQLWRLPRVGLRWRPPSLGLTSLVVLTAAVGGASVLLPSTPVSEWVRFGLAICCIPWFVLMLRRAQREGAETTEAALAPASASDPLPISIDAPIVEDPSPRDVEARHRTGSSTNDDR